jgi:hypothetical protein
LRGADQQAPALVQVRVSVGAPIANTSATARTIFDIEFSLVGVLNARAVPKLRPRFFVAGTLLC